MKFFKLYLNIAVLLATCVTFTACSSSDEDDELGGGNTEATMEKICGKSFRYNDPSVGDDSYHEYVHYLVFEATSDNGGTYSYRLDWKDVDMDGTQRGTLFAYGDFTVDGSKVVLTRTKGEAFEAKVTLKLSGNNLVTDKGKVYEYYGTASDVSTHNHPLDWWQRQYNSCISSITISFIDLDAAKAMGDKRAAEEYVKQIKQYQEAARLIREEAQEDGWTIKQDPYETKKASA